MNTFEIIGWLALTLFALLGSAWCSGFETGMYTVNRVRLNIRVARGERRALSLRRELDGLNRSLATLLIANTIFGSIISLGTTHLLSTGSFSDATLVVLNLLLVTPLLVVFGEALPKELFRVEADRLNYWTVSLLVWIRRLLTICGLIPLVDAIAALATRWVKTDEPSALLTPRHAMAALLKEGAQHGILSEAQTSMVDRALLMRDTLVRGEMVPWARVRTIPVNGNRRQLAGWLERESFTTYPVVNPQGDVIGVITHLDLCLKLDTSIDKLMKPALRLSPDMSVHHGLRELRRAAAMIGIVMSDNKPLGIVSPRDLIDPLLTPDVPTDRR
jgi:putative hemolysin